MRVDVYQESSGVVQKQWVGCQEKDLRILHFRDLFVLFTTDKESLMSTDHSKQAVYNISTNNIQCLHLPTMVDFVV